MIFRCEREEIARAVAFASRAVQKRGNTAADDGVLIEAREKSVTASGYDLRTGIQSEFEAEVFESGAVVLGCSVFSQILQKLPSGEITIKCDADLNVSVTEGRSSFKLKGIKAEDFPALPDVESLDSVEMDASVLIDLIQGVSFAASTNESKPLYTGILFEISGGIVTTVALDGYRLAKRSATLAENVPNDMKFVIPASALREVVRFAKGGKRVTLRLGKLHTAITANNTTLFTRRLEGEFMDWRKVLDSQGDICATVNRGALAECLDRVSVVLSDKFKSPVICRFADNTLHLTAETVIGRSEEQCNVACTDELRIGFNCRYLLDAINAADGNSVRLLLKNAISACVIRAEDDSDDSFAYMVLPVRIKDEQA